MSAAGPDLAVMLRAFDARLERALPFREDAALLRELGAELQPVLQTLACAYAVPADSGASAAHEGFSLFNLLARRAGLLGATPSAAPALARGVVSALEAAACQLSAAQRDDLLLVALEGYAAGRDERRARELCRDGADDQVSCELAPGCFAIFLAGAPAGERLEPLLDELSRRLFRADARSLLLDLSRLSDLDEEGARALLHFGATLGGLGTQVFLCGAERLDAWRERLGLPELGAHSEARFEAARDAALGAAGYELRRTRGRAREWLERVRPGQR
jgi:anti-anti-sigma regulatory factor